ncbi:uncharacterized protein CPUR_08329 [Claviceps purpurea 20.1]|uniref:Uncharacterized protein n=1 Tax=Claviceps purpurea (strain 20.1) TaxID=1111077 RepID=M1VYU6_CLAP2|nr:uncharacterized protein CPUR_08329 [Claviceps purpurea 20.1]
MSPTMQSSVFAASQPDCPTAAEDARVIAGQLESCRNLPAVPDGSELAVLAARMNVFEGRMTNIEDSVDSLSGKMDSFHKKLSAIDSQLQEMREANAKMASRLTQMDSRTYDQFKDMDSQYDSMYCRSNQMDLRVNQIDSRLNQMDTRVYQTDTRVYQMESSVKSRFKDTNSRLTEMRSDMNSQFAEMNKKYVKSDIKMEALNRNTISRFANKMPWAPDDILEPLFNLDTGAEIRGVHFRADLDRMSYAAMADCLRELELVPKESEEDRLRQLKEAYGAEIRVRSVLMTYAV